MVRIKICGITKLEDAKLAADLGAHAIGLNFYDASPRCITPFAAAELIRRLPLFIATIGVFVNWTQAPVIALCKALGLSAAQLHGDETQQIVDGVARRLPVIKALRLGQGSTAPNFSRLSQRLRLLAGLRSLRPLRRQRHHRQLAPRARRRSVPARHPRRRSHSRKRRRGHPHRPPLRRRRNQLASKLRPGKKDPAKLRAFFDEVTRASRDIS